MKKQKEGENKSVSFNEGWPLIRTAHRDICLRRESIMMMISLNTLNQESKANNSTNQRNSRIISLYTRLWAYRPSSKVLLIGVATKISSYIVTLPLQQRKRYKFKSRISSGVIRLQSSWIGTLSLFQVLGRLYNISDTTYTEGKTGTSDIEGQ